MRVAGIVAEYDPFHNGHAAHIAAVRAAGATHIVAVMSGSFTQRGEPAMFSKFTRTEAALAGGVDLVLELPVAWAMAPAETFATGGISLLQGLGCVDTVCFGSECGNITALRELAALSDTPSYRERLHAALSTGIPYAAAKQKAAADHPHAALLSHPNNTLGIEYIRAAQCLKADFSFFTVPRIGVEHDASVATDTVASGSRLRELLGNGEENRAARFLPATSVSVLHKAIADGTAPADSRRLDTALLAKLRCMTADDFAALPYISEGIENRLFRTVQTATDIPSLLEQLKTRRYPMARLKRLLWAAMLDIPASMPKNPPPYIRLLGMTERGRELLAEAKPTLPLLSRATQIKQLTGEPANVFALERRATDLHALLMPHPQPCGTDFTVKYIHR